MKLSKKDKKILIDTIHYCINDHSGGLKFTELICEVQSYLHENFPHLSNKIVTMNDMPILNYSDLLEDICRNDKTLKVLDYTDLLEDICRNDKTLKVLDYTWKELNRAKMFIYTP